LSVWKRKEWVIGREMPDESDLFEAVTEILNDISGVEFQRVFRSWIERVEKAIDARRDYLPS
jgi:hypothetical protein